MNKRTCVILSTTMMSIATAACAFCVAQSANAAETSTAAGVSLAVNSSTPSSATSSNTATSSTATSNRTNGGGLLLLKVLRMK